jgi:hypothetical protein
MNQNLTTLYVAFVPSLTDEDLEDMFSRFGPCKIGKEGAFHVITYEDYRDARDAHTTSMFMNGKFIHCEFTKEKALDKTEYG